MPNIKSAAKRVEITAKRTLRNKAIKSQVKTAIKNFRTTLDGDLPEQKQLALRKAIRALDKAVTKGVLHPNTAARKKSRLQKLMNKAISSSPVNTAQ